MNAKLAVMSLSLSLAVSGVNAAGNQPVQTDYQRIMNSVNNSSGAAFGQPQPDDDADNSTDDGTNANTPTTPQANAQGDPADTANLPANGIANSYSANGSPGGFGAATGHLGYGTSNPGTTTSGAPGLGAYNASPYNSAPNSNGRGTPTFTGGQ